MIKIIKMIGNFKSTMSVQKCEKIDLPLFQELDQTSRDLSESIAETQKSRDVSLNSSKSGISKFSDSFRLFFDVSCVNFQLWRVPSDRSRRELFTGIFFVPNGAILASFRPVESLYTHLHISS